MSEQFDAFKHALEVLCMEHCVRISGAGEGSESGIIVEAALPGTPPMRENELIDYTEAK